MEQGDKTGAEARYQPPRIDDHGRLTDITAGHTMGTVMDHEFPTHVHRKDMGFS